MIQPNELRIGNYLLLLGKPIAISSGFIADYDFSLNHNFNEDTPIIKGKVQPIPLTEQWLLDFGFEKKSRIDIGELKPCFAIFSFAVMVRHNSYFIDWIGGNTEVKHVHQLQNLYFALTGQELTLKENK